MKAFFEEYGLIIVVIIVIAVLISIAVLQSQRGKQQISDTFNSFSNSANTIVDKAMDQAETAVSDDKAPASGS